MLSKHPSRRVALLGLLGLAGCGFAPVYDTAQQGVFAVDTDDSVMGFRLSGRMVERLGPAQSPRFVIKATLNVSQRGAAITADGDTSRLNVIGNANWTLTDIATNRQIETGKVSAFTSYSATGSTVATQSAQDDARARLAVMLADMIITRVLIAAPDANT